MPISRAYRAKTPSPLAMHAAYFELHNIETDFLPHFKEFYGSETKRTCTSCGHVMETDPRFT